MIKNTISVNGGAMSEVNRGRGQIPHVFSKRVSK